MAPTNAADPRTEQFIQRWHQAAGSELATAQSFVIELCELPEVERPCATADQNHMFERPLKEGHSNGSEIDRRVDCCKRLLGRRALSCQCASAATASRLNNPQHAPHIQKPNHLRLV